MASGRYKRALQILEKWPLDPFKSKERDLGALLRTRISSEFRQGEQTQLHDPDLCDKQLQSLENICNNKYKSMYKTEMLHGSLGLTHEVSCDAVSDKSLNALRKERTSPGIGKYFRLFKNGDGDDTKKALS